MERLLYREGTANYPRLRTDVLWADYDNRYAYTGFVDQAIRYIEDFQLLRPELWRRFVEQFRHDADNDAGWKGEFWGKMMRGACFTYSYTRDSQLYDILEQTVRDMMESVGADGYVDVTLPQTDTAPYPHIVEACVPLKNGASITVTDYASAGKL